MSDFNPDKYPKCPICYTVWSKTRRIVCNGYWYHCEKCKKKASDIVKDYNEKKKATVNPIKTTTDWSYGGFLKEENPKITGDGSSIDWDKWDEDDWESLFTKDKRGKAEFAL